MSSFQNSVNQLIGSLSYYSSINPSLRERQAERKATEHALNMAKKADNATKQIDAQDSADIENFKDTHDIMAINRDKEKSKDLVKDIYASGQTRNALRDTVLRNKENAYENLFLQQPNDKNLREYQEATKARIEFENKAGQQVKQNREFMKFWDKIDKEAGDKHTYVEAQNAYNAAKNVKPKEEEGGK